MNFARWFWVWGCLLSALAGCEKRRPQAPPADSSRLSLLATVYPMAQLAQQVGSDHVQVEWLCEANKVPEELGDNPQLRQRANKADLVITSGPWDVWAVRDVTEEARLLRLIQPELLSAARDTDAKSYLWLDPRIAMDLAGSLGQRLVQIDPALEKPVAANVAETLRKLDLLDRELRVKLGRWDGREVMVIRPVWSAMLARYGLVQVAAPEPEAEKLTDAHLKALTKRAKEAGAKAVYVDVFTPAAVRQRIAEKTGLDVLMLDAMGTSAPAGRSTYESILRYNAQQLVAGFGKEQ